MSRLYRYADSNDKTGLYLLDGYKGQNTTFQVSTLAEKLFYHLEYEPVIRSQKQGPRIPDELHWGLFEVGWVYTNESGFTPPTNDDGVLIIEGEGVEITEEIATDLKTFLKETEGDDIEELAEILNIDISGKAEESSSGFSTPSGISEDETKPSDFPTLSGPPIWQCSDSQCQEFAEQVKTTMQEELPKEGSALLLKPAEGAKIEIDGVEKATITIQTTPLLTEYLHIAYFCPEHGFERIVTATNEDCDWDRRVELEHRRQGFIKSLIITATEQNVAIGEPDADLNLITDYNSEVLE